LGDATGQLFSPFLVRGPPNAIWGTRLEMLLEVIVTVKMIKIHVLPCYKFFYSFNKCHYNLL
jgi:hypothetical protein